MSKFKQGDRVRVVSPSYCDSKAGVKPGMTGTVIAEFGDDPVVRFDNFIPSSHQWSKNGGWWLLDRQLEPVEACIASHTETIIEVPAYALTNAELQTAIDQAHALLMRDRVDSIGGKMREHLEGLLRVQLARAEKDLAE